MTACRGLVMERFSFARPHARLAAVRAALGLFACPVCLVCLVVCAGCLPEPETPAEPAPLTRTGNAWADCYRRFQPGEDPGADLARLGEACAAPAGLRPLGLPHQGALQGSGDAPERLSFRAQRGCYRAFAVGGAGVGDLDVAVYDASGRLATGDVSRDRWPVVPPRGPLCVEDEGVYTVAVSVARGRGDYVLQIWGPATGEGRPAPP
jgi:hypothetical protein